MTTRDCSNPTQAALSIDEVWQILEAVRDPEIPVLSIQDLGVLREIHFEDGELRVTITPTYSGCPAMDRIREQINEVLAARGIDSVRILTRLSPAWSSDWLSERGKARLERYGIAPPRASAAGRAPVVPCPRCHATDTRLVSEFGSTACKALYSCNSCLEPFDYFKCL
ncbi:MAG: phenylacetate-CoA oxygenase subunit PaaJ [Gammaproteobacteria bacterium]|nr:phenylacetate-CoA oxygenase subunit PaaJ [Gammaproteobacteria bacterium]